MSGTTDNRLRIALLGTGFMGRAHSNAWRQVGPFFEPACEPVLQVVCARDPERTREFARRWGWAESSTNWREVVSRDDIDVVDITFPNNLLAEVALEAARHGKHLLCEKPMAMNVAESGAMVAAVEKAGIVNAVCYNYRKAPAVALARQIIDEGRVGEIRHWRGAYLQEWLTDSQTPMRWKVQKAAAGFGPHGDLNSHSVDLAHYLVGPIRSVSCKLTTFVTERPAAGGAGAMEPVEVDDASQLHVQFENGAIGSFETSRYAPGRRNHNQFEIYGSRGALRWCVEDMNWLEFFSLDDPPHLRGFRRIMVSDPSHPYVGKWWKPGHNIGYEHTFVHIIADFLEAIHENRDACPNFRDGSRVMEVLVTAQEAFLASTMKPVSDSRPHR